jgi:hypothetical protein
MWFIFQSQFCSRQKVVVEHFSIVRVEFLEPPIVMWFYNTISALDEMDLDEPEIFLQSCWTDLLGVYIYFVANTSQQII